MRSEKKAYQKPVILLSTKRIAAKNICGWYTTCGSQVKCRN